MGRVVESLAGRRGDSRAHALLRAAHESGYRFEPGFRGFRANLYYTDDLGNETGRATVVSPTKVEVECDLREGRDWARRELASIAGHRWPMPYEQGDGRYRLKLGREDHPLGALIEVGDRYGSAYRVSGGRISYVRRKAGGKRFEISILDRAHTGDGRVLPSQFTVSYWDDGLNLLLGTDTYTDAYAEFGGVYLPTARLIVSAVDGGLRVRSLVLDRHETL